MPSATSTLGTLGALLVTTAVDLATVVITTYWPYIIVFGILAGLVALFAKFAHLGMGSKR